MRSCILVLIFQAHCARCIGGAVNGPRGLSGALIGLTHAVYYGAPPRLRLRQAALKLPHCRTSLIPGSPRPRLRTARRRSTPRSTCPAACPPSPPTVRRWSSPKQRLPVKEHRRLASATNVHALPDDPDRYKDIRPPIILLWLGYVFSINLVF